MGGSPPVLGPFCAICQSEPERAGFFFYPSSRAGLAPLCARQGPYSNIPLQPCTEC